MSTFSSNRVTVLLGENRRRDGGGGDYLGTELVFGLRLISSLRDWSVPVPKAPDG